MDDSPHCGYCGTEIDPTQEDKTAEDPGGETMCLVCYVGVGDTDRARCMLHVAVAPLRVPDQVWVTTWITLVVVFNVWLYRQQMLVPAVLVTVAIIVLGSIWIGLQARERAR